MSKMTKSKENENQCPRVIHAHKTVIRVGNTVLPVEANARRVTSKSTRKLWKGEGVLMEQLPLVELHPEPADLCDCGAESSYGAHEITDNEVVSRFFCETHADKRFK